jgi:hypothetical protein
MSAFLLLLFCLLTSFSAFLLILVLLSHSQGVNATEDLQAWLERAEKVEGLRAKGMQAAQLLNNVRQCAGLM